MTKCTLSSAVKVDVYPDEFVPLLKVMNKFMDDSNWEAVMSPDEMSILSLFLDDFKGIALQNAA